MEAPRNDNPPARGRPHGPVIWDRASWYGNRDDPAAWEEGAQHIGVMLRWLWAHGQTTAAGDLAAQGDFSGLTAGEPALTSDMVVEPAALFLDHYYGAWLAALPTMGDDAFDDQTLDALWSDYEQNRATLDRVWDLG
jgi:hypothetical protein